MRKLISIVAVCGALATSGAAGAAVQTDAIILRCTASSAFKPIVALRSEATATFRIDGSSVEIYSTETGQWVQHPCVYDTQDGQFCAITPTQMVFREAHLPISGIVDSRKITIDRTTGSFEVAGLVTGPSLFERWDAAGTSAPGEAPAPPATQF